MIDNSHIYSNKTYHNINHFSINFTLRLCKTIIENSYIVATQCFELIKTNYIKYAKKSIKLTENVKNEKCLQKKHICGII